MGKTTGIEWTQVTWNPWYGCEKVSPGCAHCYAERDMTRYGKRFEHLRTAIETQLRLFFQQDTVKTRLRNWQREGIEPNSATVSYLEGQDPYPEVRDVASLDRYLSGLELTAELDLAPVVELLTKRAWERKSLLAALEEELARQGDKRLRFIGDLGAKVPPALYEWCAEQCMRYGVPLPPGLGRATLDGITQCLRPEWAGRDTIEHLSALGLDEAGETKLLRWLIDGHIPFPEPVDPKDPLLAAVAMLLRPTAPADAAELATDAHAAYLAHARLQRIGGERWLACMNGLAETTLSGLPPLVEVLKAHSIAQWVLIDCLGLPLIPALSGRGAVFSPSRSGRGRG
ncbi:MAG: phage Gp37/Gp68 family protein [Chloroflexi bacterium]|nr:phage Gp37/Gp68 family protein [Chloroflexota bacterium]